MPSPFGTMRSLNRRMPRTRTESQSAKCTAQNGALTIVTSSSVTSRHAEKMSVWNGRSRGTYGPSPSPEATSRKRSFCRVCSRSGAPIRFAAVRSMNASLLPSIVPRPVIDTPSTRSAYSNPSRRPSSW